ncbi:MAG: hypothetical protein IPO93_06450 [Actinobacteria bacterium]|nr:hypothetical protein [Actinomycetota bacterium]
MSKDDADPLAKWRESEAAYAVAAKPFMKASNDAPPLKKKDLVELVQLRGKADRWRERYFKDGHS